MQDRGRRYLVFAVSGQTVLRIVRAQFMFARAVLSFEPVSSSRKPVSGRDEKVSRKTDLACRRIRLKRPFKRGGARLSDRRGRP